MVEFIKVKSLVSDVVADASIAPAKVKPKLLAKWATDAAAQLDIVENMQEYVVLKKIKDWKATLEPNTKVICEIAAREDVPITKECGRVMGYQIVQWKQATTLDGCEIELNLRCNSCKKTECTCQDGGFIVDIDHVFEDAHPEYYGRHLIGYDGAEHFGYGAGQSVAHPKFRLLRPTDNPWDKVKHLPNCANIKCPQSNKDTYKINKTVIDTSIKQGWVLISYLGACEDDDGDRILEISDRSGINAIVEYVKYKHFYSEYVSSREASSRALYQEAEDRFYMHRTQYLANQSTSGMDKMFDYLRNSRSQMICDAYQCLLDGNVNIKWDSWRK